MNPGDLIVADLNGVVVVQYDVAAQLLEKLVERTPSEESYLREVAAGKFSNEWVDNALRDAGAEIPDPPSHR